MKNRKMICCLVLSAFLFCSPVTAQIPVSEEAHHKVVFQNEYVRLLEGQIPAHDTTVAHVHAAASVIVFLSKSTFGIQIVGESPVITRINNGDTKYAAYGEKPVTHRVWNEGESMFHFMVAEIVKQNTGNDTCSIITKPDIKFQWQQKLVRVYNLDIDKGKKYNLPKSNCAYLLINVSGIVTAESSGSIHTLQTDGFVFFPPQSNIEIDGSNKENAKCVLLELK